MWCVHTHKHTHTMLVDVACIVELVKSLRYCKLEVLEQKAEQEADVAQWDTCNPAHMHPRVSCTLIDVTH